jgi:hypothetical protein
MKTIGLVCGGVLGALLAVGCSSASVAPLQQVDGGDAGRRMEAGKPKKDGAIPVADAARDARKPVVDASPEHDATKPAPDASRPPGDAAKPVGDAARDVKTTSEAGGKGDAAKDAGAPARHVLVTYDSTNPSAVVAVNLATKAIDGDLETADPEAVTDTSNALAPFLLNQTLDVVDRIDPTTWTIDGSWSVAVPGDAGGAISDPYAVVVASESHVYVVRYLSNVVDVIDTTTAADGGKPTASIDLSGLVQANDQDGVVEATAAAYVPGSKLLYVVLGNIDRNTVAPPDYDLLCVQTTSTVVAIDTTSNTLVSLTDAGPGGGIALQGYDPVQGGTVYDAPNHRLLVFEAGCNPASTSDGGAPGAVQRRGVEEVDLTARTTKILLDASDQGFPGSFVYVSPTQAAISFTSYVSYTPAYSAFAWDPTSTVLGSPLPNAPDVFDHDGAGNLVGASIFYGDGGAATSDILSMSLGTGAATTLQSNVIKVGNGYIGSVGVWPRP